MSTEPAPFRLGFLTHVHGAGRSSADVLSALVDTIQAAEDLGLDGAFVAQHHFRSDYGRLPSPLVLLAAAAQRTSRIELGTAISTVPLEDPLRFAEDAAVLDHLAGGRLQLGLGTGGANRDAFAAFGIDPDTLDERYDRAVALVHEAFAGRALPGTDALLAPRPDGLRDRVWQSTARPEKAARIGADGDGLFIGTFIHDPEEVQLPLVRAYREAYAGPGVPRVGAARAVFPAASREAALNDLGRGLAVFREHTKAFVDWSGHDDAQLAARINVHYGTPEEVAASLQADPALLGHVDYFFPVVQHEASSPDEDIARLEVLATQIAPALGWRPAERTAA